MAAWSEEESTRKNDSPEGGPMIALGLILLIIGLLVASLHVLVVIGIILLVIGLILALLGASGRAIGGRRHWY
jgi:uncharacterized membrane protein